MVALSVSISAMMSPDCTRSPSRTCHLVRVPSSMVGDNAGIRISVGMAQAFRSWARAAMASSQCWPSNSVIRPTRNGAVVEAAHIDAEAVGLGAWDIEALDAAYRAEMMLRRAGVETVWDERVPALQQPEALSRHDQVHIARHAADRAVAFLDLDLVRRQHLVAHRAAVTAAVFQLIGASVTRATPGSIRLSSPRRCRRWMATPASRDWRRRASARRRR